MDWKDIIKNYKTYNQQEKSDKNLILEAMKTFDDILTRKNKILHLTSSVFVVNPTRNKILMVHHNIYNNWSWIGGHCDGESDFLKVAIKELKEETGVKNFKELSDEIFSLDVLPVKAHLKNGEFISGHLHLSIAYLFEVDEDEILVVKEDENSDVKWIEIENLIEMIKSEEHMITLYEKLIKKLEAYKNL